MNIIFSCFKVTSNPKCLVKEYYFHLDINLCVLIQELFLYFWIANSFESSSSISGLTLALFWDYGCTSRGKYQGWRENSHQELNLEKGGEAGF